jgi:hypothetical protein
MVAHNFVAHLLLGPWKNLLLQSFLFYFSLLAQEVLPLTNILSLQENVLIFHPIGANFALASLTPPLSSPLMYLCSFIYSNLREVPARRCSGFTGIPGLKEIANMET